MKVGGFLATDSTLYIPVSFVMFGGCILYPNVDWILGVTYSGYFFASGWRGGRKARMMR